VIELLKGQPSPVLSIAPATVAVAALQAELRLLETSEMMPELASTLRTILTAAPDQLLLRSAIQMLP